MSPILVRPVREQLEHDRVIRLLQAKYKRKFDVAINPGNEQGTPVAIGPSAWYPDLVLHSTERNRKILGVVEVETVESINHLEAMSQWAAFARLKTAFHLYVPAGMVDVARRFCLDLNIAVTEVWAYHAIGDQIRFTPVQRAPGADEGEARRPKAAVAAAAQVVRPPAVKPVAKPAARPAAAKAATPKSAPAKPSRRPVPPVRKKTVRSAKPVKAAVRPAAKKPAVRASKRK